MRAGIRPGFFGGREVFSAKKVRLLGEDDRTFAGTRYLWVKSLDIVE